MTMYMYIIKAKIYHNRDLWGYVLQDRDGNRCVYNKSDTFRLAGNGLIHGVRLNSYPVSLYSTGDTDLRSLNRVQLCDILKTDKNSYIDDKSLKNIKGIAPNAFAGCGSIDRIELNHEISNIKPNVFMEMHPDKKIKNNIDRPNKKV